MDPQYPLSTRFLLRATAFAAGVPLAFPARTTDVADGYCLVVQAGYAEELEQQLAMREPPLAATAALDTELDRLRQELTHAHVARTTLTQQVHTLTDELTRWRTGGVTEALLRTQDGFLKVGRGCVLIREDDHQRYQHAVGLLEQILHQLATDADLEDRVSAPATYARLEQQTRRILADLGRLPIGSRPAVDSPASQPST